MAYNHQVDYNLQKIALDGFAFLEKHYGRGSQQRHTPPVARRPQDQYHQLQKLGPNQYSYEEPDGEAYVPAKEPAFRNYRPPTKQCSETWYFLRVPQAPKQEEAVISSTQAAENYGGILFNDYAAYKNKPHRWGYN